MKCLETKTLIGYAYHLTDEPAASQVRAHLGECPRCREIVEQHGRLDALLDEWKAADPTPGFDARVRQAVEAQQARGGAWSFDWARGLALASVGVLLIAGVVWFTRSHLRVSHTSAVATRQSPPASGAQTPARAQSPAVTAQTRLRAARAVTKPNSTGTFANEDQGALTLEDYDLAANFDLLSELPKREPRVAN